jgi:hypothetical protein
MLLSDPFPDERQEREDAMGRLSRIVTGLCVGALAVLAAAASAYGQDAPSADFAAPQTVVDVLHQLSDQAEIIFAGQVMAIRRPNAGVIEVEFRVDQGIRGCTAGTPYVLREWAGLWEGGNQRYQVGQHLLMLLHAPSAAGMSSPVGGLDGAIPIRQGGAGSAVGDAATPRQPPFVDLRWLGARLPHTVSYRKKPVPAAAGAMPFVSQAQAMGLAASNGTAPATVMVGSSAGSSGSSVPAQQASVDAVMGMLSSWQKAQHAAP